MRVVNRFGASTQAALYQVTARRNERRPIALDGVNRGQFPTLIDKGRPPLPVCPSRRLRDRLIC